MFRDFEEEEMGGEKQIFVDVAMVIKTMLLNPGMFILFARWISSERFLSRRSWGHELDKTEVEALTKMKSSYQMTQENIRYDFRPKSTWSTTVIYRIWKSCKNKEFFEADYQALSQLYANNWSTASGCRHYRTRGKWLPHKQALVYRSQRMIKTDC